MVAVITPINAALPGGACAASPMRGWGVNTTQRAVMNAALDAVVYWIPTVWVIKLPQISTPNVTPLYTVLRVADPNFLAAKG